MLRSQTLITLLVVALAAGGCRSSISWKETFKFTERWDKRTSEEHLTEARRLENAREFDAAEEQYAAALRKSPDSLDAQHGLTELQRTRQGQWGEIAAASDPARRKPEENPGSRERPLFAEDTPNRRKPSNYDRWNQEQLAENGFGPQQKPPQSVSNTTPAPVNEADLPEWGRSLGPSLVSSRSMSTFAPAVVALDQPGDLQLPTEAARSLNPFVGPRIVPRYGTPAPPTTQPVAAVATVPPVALNAPVANEPRSLQIDETETVAITSDIAELQARLIHDPADLPAIRAVIHRLGDPDRSKRWLAASLLENLVGTPQRQLVIAQLGEGLQKESDDVRVQIALLLGSLGPNAAEALPDLRLSLQDRNGDVRRAAADAIPKVGL